MKFARSFARKTTARTKQISRCWNINRFAKYETDNAALHFKFRNRISTLWKCQTFRWQHCIFDTGYVYRRVLESMSRYKCSYKHGHKRRSVRNWILFAFGPPVCPWRPSWNSMMFHRIAISRSIMTRHCEQRVANDGFHGYGYPTMHCM